MAIFSKFFGDLMSHIIREYADEEIKYFLYVSPLKIMGILLSDFMVSSLYIKFDDTVKNCILSSGYICSVSYSDPWPSAQTKHIFSNG